jgi:hypothetical protein
VGHCGLSPRRLRCGLNSAGVMSLWRDEFLHVHILFFCLLLHFLNRDIVLLQITWAAKEIVPHSGGSLRTPDRHLLAQGKENDPEQQYFVIGYAFLFTMVGQSASTMNSRIAGERGAYCKNNLDGAIGFDGVDRISR